MKDKLLVISELFADGPQQAPGKIAISQTGLYTPAFGDPKDITEEMFDKMIENMEANVLKTKPSVYYSHWDSKRAAAGEIKELYKSYNEDMSKTILYANVEWTPQGKRAILEKEYKYISAEFAYDFKRPVNKEGSYESFGAVLTGVALTNEPAVYDIPQIVFSGAPSFQKKFLAQFQNMGSNKKIVDPKTEGDIKMDKLLKAMNVKNEDEALEAYSHLTTRLDGLEKQDFSKKLKEKDSAINLLKEEIETMKKAEFTKEKKTFLDGLFKEEKIDKEKYEKAMGYNKEQFSVFTDMAKTFSKMLPSPAGSPAMEGKDDKPEKSFAQFAENLDVTQINKGAI